MSKDIDTILDEGNYSSISFLHNCTKDELEPIVKILTDSSTSKLDNDSEYLKHYPDHTKYTYSIIDDYETFGGNTIMNKVRGYGVGYAEILKDVCKEMKVKIDKNASLNTMEISLITKITEDAIEKMTPQELEEFVKGIDPKATVFTKSAVLMVARTAIKSAGFSAYTLLTKLIYLIGTKILGKTVPWAVYQGSAKWLGAFAGPVGLALTSAWTIIDIAGPAYRITIPTTIYIASLRQAKLYEIQNPKCSKCATPNSKNSKFCSECGNLLGDIKRLN